MRPTDQIDAIVRRSAHAVDAACRSYRDALTRHRASGEPDAVDRRAAREELIAAAERDGAVMPRVLMPAESAAASPHESSRAHPETTTQPEPPIPQAMPPDEPGFGVGWLTDR
ncbi:hypothetical protein [Jongsikchunia kroppenstedtii]|uniref:hypothetical protein n=1 Tax=Jongsikchunia kroppenstedtii TaxID=1121721 RepID=UPI0003607DBB|nr:hypothetical protein [Jongsikchunia kroppenstedtii]